MADQSVYRLTAVGGASLLKAVDSNSVTYDHGVKEEMPYGQSLTPLASFNFTASPTLKFTQGYVDDLYSPTVVDAFGAYWQAFDDDGTEGTGGISMVGKVLLVPNSVSADANSPAKFDQTAHWLGADLPTVGTTTKTVQTTDKIFRMGASTLDGTAIDELVSQELSFNYEIEFNVGRSGNVYPTSYVFRRINPVMTFVTKDLSLVKNYVNGPVEITTSAAAMKFDASTTGGYDFTFVKASVIGSIKNDEGTLTVTSLNAGGELSPAITGAAYA